MPGRLMPSITASQRRGPSSGFLTTGLTDARTEGTNRLIKQVKRAACGFRNRRTIGAEYGCTAPGAPADCQRETRRCPPKVEEPENTALTGLPKPGRCKVFVELLALGSGTMPIKPAPSPSLTSTARTEVGIVTVSA